MQSAILARGLTRQFGPIRAVNGIDLEIGRGESVAIFGPNGAGKTTLVELLTLQLRPSSGELAIDGLKPRGDGERIRRNLGVISHQSFLYDDLTAEQNLEFFGRLYGISDPAARATELLDLIGLGSRGRDPVGTFSRGMQQRVSLARALVHDPSILFLDEPFTGLDPDAARRLRGTLSQLRAEGRTLILVTHDLQRGLELSDRWLILRRGKIVADGLSSETEAGGLEATYFESVGAPANRS